MIRAPCYCLLPPGSWLLASCLLLPASCLLVPGCVPPNGGAANTNANSNSNASGDQSHCEQDSDCACGVHIDSGACFVGNEAFVDTDPALACPDFCSGIAGHLVTRCIDNECQLSEAGDGGETGNINTNGSEVNENTNQNGSGDTNGNENGASEESDPCGNAVGNGDEVISGPSEPGEGDRDSVFRSLTVHPADPDIVWVGSERNGFLKTTDGGATWTRLRVGLRHFEDNGTYPEIWDIAVSASDPDILIAATLDSPGPVTGDYPSSIGGVYKSTDGGATWARKNCGFETSRATAVAIDPSNPDIMAAGLEGGEPSFSELAGQFFNGGLYHSTDGGENWTEIVIDGNDGRNGFWHVKLSGQDPSTFITFGINHEDLSQNHGFLRSEDSGQTWGTFATSFRELGIFEFDVSSDGMTLYANERDSFVIQKSTDGGQSWAEFMQGRANGPIAVSPTDPDVVLFAGTQDLTRSTDGLSSTTQVLTAEANIEDVVFAPSDPNVVYVGAVGLLIYKSTDAGQSFEFIANLRADVLNAD